MARGQNNCKDISKIVWFYRMHWKLSYCTNSPTSLMWWKGITSSKHIRFNSLTWCKLEVCTIKKEHICAHWNIEAWTWCYFWLDTGLRLVRQKWHHKHVWLWWQSHKRDYLVNLDAHEILNYCPTQHILWLVRAWRSESYSLSYIFIDVSLSRD